MSLKNLPILVSALFLGLVGCQKKVHPAEESDISATGGEAVAEDHWLAKSVVGIGKHCSGVIISQFHILTAGHCGRDDRGGEIFFGTDSKDPIGKRKGEFLAHPDYRDIAPTNQVNDIAIITLDAPIPEGFSPLPLGKKPSPFGKHNYVAGGFGITGTNEHDFGKLHAIKPKRVKKKDRTFQATFVNSQGICQGDSGSALVHEDGNKKAVIGIASMASCEHGNAIFASVDEYREWIDKIVGQKKPFDPKDIKTKTFEFKDLDFDFQGKIYAIQTLNLEAPESHKILGMKISVLLEQNKPGHFRLDFKRKGDDFYNTVAFINEGESAPATPIIYPEEKLQEFIGTPILSSWEISTRRDDLTLVPRIKHLQFIFEYVE